MQRGGFEGGQQIIFVVLLNAQTSVSPLSLCVITPLDRCKPAATVLYKQEHQAARGHVSQTHRVLRESLISVTFRSNPDSRLHCGSYTNTSHAHSQTARSE